MPNKRLKLRCRMTENGLIFMAKLLVRSEGQVAKYHRLLCPKYVETRSAPAGLIIRALFEHYEAHGTAPTLASLQERIQEAEGFAVVIEQAQEIVEEAFSKEDFVGRVAEQYCIKEVTGLLEEQYFDALRNVKVGNLTQTLQDAYDRVLDLANIGQPQDSLMFEPGWQLDIAPKLRSTGLRFLDGFLGGGVADGEVYGLMGPYGSCKTTLAVQFLVEAARSFRADALAGKPAKFAVLASYEESKADINRRAIGYAARIPRERLEEPTLTLSTSNTLQPYERKLYGRLAQAGCPVQGERERSDSVIPWLNQHIHMIEFVRRGGTGGVKEIEGRIAQEALRRGAQCGLVVVDYAGALVRKQIELVKGDLSRAMRKGLQDAVWDCRERLANSFNCPVWLIHQLSGSANARGPGFLQDHTQAAECRSFAENLDFSFSVGKPTRENLAIFGCTKHRRRPPRESLIVRIDGRFNRVLADRRYVFDQASRRIMPKWEVDRVVAAARSR